MAAKIEDYALIGDCETAALVGRDGAIDWLCWPRFDSGACFAALLGTADNGRWLLGAADPTARLSRHYRDQTLILETEIETASGAATVIDFMPPRGRSPDLVRLVRGRRGRVAMRTELAVRFDYGSLVPWMTRLDDGGLCLIEGPDLVVLRSSIAWRGDHDKATAEFTVAAGETVSFVLSYGASHLMPPGPIAPLAVLQETETYWREWAGRVRPAKQWTDAVIRSLITLKALIHRPTGGMVAAPTTSLPERLGGTRNWDYRFCWLRDATFTLLSLMNAGLYEDARAWRQWLLRTTAGDPAKIQIMYGVTGEHRLPETEVPWLAGYEGSRPVRIGNAAATQLQLDVYGEIVDAIYHGRQGKLAAEAAGWHLQLRLLEHFEAVWREPGHGIWEVRGDKQHFTIAKVMAWVAFDRAVKSAEQFNMDGPVEHWRMLRRKIHDEVCRFGFNPDLGAFVQSYGSHHLDASALLIALVGFLPADDPRVRSTIDAVRRNLVRGGLVMRYDSEAGIDGLPPGEGAFLPCSFWLADNLLLLGRRDEAVALFEELLALRSELGLLSEEYDVHRKRLVGNFPQALSHVALVNTAYMLSDQGRHHRHQAVDWAMAH
jgi:GH15 family glucan-1,4-alpha-glucosidase